MEAARQGPCKSCEPNGRLSRCDAEPRCACFEMRCATKSGYHLLKGARSREKRCAAASRDASYRDDELFVAFASGISGVCTIHFQGFAQRNAQRFKQFVAGGFLTVDAGDFFNPPDPPLSVLLHYRRISLAYGNLRTASYSAGKFGRLAAQGIVLRRATTKVEFTRCWQPVRSNKRLGMRRNYSPNTSRMTSGRLAAMVSKAWAAPDGLRRPCSHS